MEPITLYTAATMLEIQKDGLERTLVPMFSKLRFELLRKLENQRLPENFVLRMVFEEVK
jgi:hypothetical protein